MIKEEGRPEHPGEILRKQFMDSAGLSATALAKALRVTPPRINDILLKRRGVTADTALRLARYFGGQALDWLFLQARYDLYLAEVAAGNSIEHEIAPRLAKSKKNHNRSEK